MDKNSAIGVFDSGIGGLTVLSQLARFMPYEKYIYLGDTARVPYGNKSPETVKRYSAECTRFLLGKNVKMVIAACNTASSVALGTVVETAGDLPVIGMINPAAGAALRATTNRKIGVIGTRATIASGSYSETINTLSADKKVNVYTKECPMFVHLVEEGLTNHPAARLLAQDYLAPLIEKGIDTLVLGCTHYPVMARLLGELLPGVSLIDSGEHAAVTALRALAERGLLRDEKPEYVVKPVMEFYVTDLPKQFYMLAQDFLGYPVDSPVKVDLGTC